MQEKVTSLRDESIQKYILELLDKDPNGMEMSVLAESVVGNLALELKVEAKEVGPNLMGLADDRLITSFRRVDAEGTKLVFRIAKFVPLKFSSLLCTVFGHDVPDDLAFEMGLALFKGGFCRRCGTLAEKEFIGNVWTEEIHHEYVLSEEDVKRVEKVHQEMINLLPEHVREKVKDIPAPAKQARRGYTELKGYNLSPALNRGLKVMTGL